TRKHEQSHGKGPRTGSERHVASFVQTVDSIRKRNVSHRSTELWRVRGRSNPRRRAPRHLRELSVSHRDERDHPSELHFEDRARRSERGEAELHRTSGPRVSPQELGHPSEGARSERGPRGGAREHGGFTGENEHVAKTSRTRLGGASADGAGPRAMS